MTNKAKIKWHVEEAPTGRYRSFAHRGWPGGNIGEDTAFQIRCADDYTPKRAKGEQSHAILRVYVADRRGSPNSFTWRKLKGEFTNLASVKSACADFLVKYPEVFQNTVAQAEEN